VILLPFQFISELHTSETFGVCSAHFILPLRLMSDAILKNEQVMKCVHSAAVSGVLALYLPLDVQSTNYNFRCGETRTRVSPAILELRLDCRVQIQFG